MTQRRPSRKPKKSDVKAAADRAERRSRGELPDVTGEPEDEASPGAGGRPPKYKEEYAQQAAKLCKLGATDADLADFFGVTTRTISNWSAKNVKFFQALKPQKDSADARVERSLYQRAIGYEYDAVKIFQYEGVPVVVPYREKIAPDTTACIFWLKNRQKDRWRDKHEHEHTGSLAFKAVWAALADKGKSKAVAEAA